MRDSTSKSIAYSSILRNGTPEVVGYMSLRIHFFLLHWLN